VAPEKEARLEELLNGPSIELQISEVPLRDRDLLGSTASTTHCAPYELLTFMSGAFSRSRDAVMQIGQVWDTLLPRLRDVENSLEACRQLASSLDEDPPDDLASQLTVAADTIATDPLSADVRGLDRLESQIEGLRASLNEAVRF